ncbi:hypothetical protein [Kineococcus rubinsiae]|uniref:hypothetical protein n=1 Tax=Kineococcus rubinsiae TaxID=2609562 RepID=UPI0014310501|nr:hypothetical protein [Kineococcus rubinsiae]NIZ91411.1 hypothetical protein [Kineococcus rubinsiae]
MPARRRHRRPRPGPAPERVRLDALDLVADPPARPLPHGGLPDVVHRLWRARRPGRPDGRPLTLTHSRPAGAPSPGPEQPPFAWPDVVVTLHRHLLLPGLGHRAEVAAIGATVRLTSLDGAPVALGDPLARLRAATVLRGHHVDLDPAEVLAFALLHADLQEFLAAHPPGGDLDLRLVLAAAGVGLGAADVAAAHAAGTLTPDRIALLGALQGTVGW